MSYLIDTNIISELVRRKPDAAVAAWADTLDRAYLSVITLEELCYGLAWKPNPRVAQALEKVVARCLVLPVTESIGRRAGGLRGRFRRDGIQRTSSDLLIASTAHEQDLVVATRNLADFADCQVELYNPFTFGLSP